VSIKVSCTWGDGPDVLITLDDLLFMLYEPPDQLDRAVHGLVKKGSFALTADEALKFAKQLKQAALGAKNLDKEYLNYLDHKQKQKELGLYE
jgi:hypothetical protein